MYQISDSEWEVMRVIWTKGETTSSDIIGVLADKHAWSDSTVKTLIGRLVDKGLLSSRRQGRAFLYQTELSESQAYRDELDSLLDRICITEHSGLIDYLIGKTLMTISDIEGLEALLLSKKEKAVKQVICDCVPGQCRCAHHSEVSYG